MKETNNFSKNIIGIIIIGIIKFVTDAVICPALNSAIISTAVNLIYTGVICFAAALILSENGCIFPRFEKGKKLLSRNSVVRLIIAFIISVILGSSIMSRIISLYFSDIVSMSVAFGVLTALSRIAVYITMTVKNSNSPRIAGLLIVCASALVFSVLSHYISGIRMYISLQNMNGSLLGYLSAATATDYISLIIASAADMIIMCSMAFAAHFFRKKNMV